MIPESQEAIELAYAWEALANRAAREGMQYPQPLGLEPMAELSERNLGTLRPMVGRSEPEPIDTDWADALVHLSREHRGAQALARAAQLDPELAPLAARLHDSSLVYRELALEALMRVRPMS